MNRFLHKLALPCAAVVLGAVSVSAGSAALQVQLSEAADDATVGDHESRQAPVRDSEAEQDRKTEPAQEAGKEAEQGPGSRVLDSPRRRSRQKSTRRGAAKPLTYEEALERYLDELGQDAPPTARERRTILEQAIAKRGIAHAKDEAAQRAKLRRLNKARAVAKPTKTAQKAKADRKKQARAQAEAKAKAKAKAAAEAKTKEKAKDKAKGKAQARGNRGRGYDKRNRGTKQVRQNVGW